MANTEDNEPERIVPTNTTEGFTDKVAFVTGAASGIGRTTAVAFARAGADVAVADITEESRIPRRNTAWSVSPRQRHWITQIRTFA